MNRVCVLQCDDRPTKDFVALTREVNSIACKELGYTYIFVDINNTQYSFTNKQYTKMYVVKEILEKKLFDAYEFDTIVFMDSDAWIQHGKWLSDIVKSMTTEGCFSRDLYLKSCTYINSGGFILKNSEFIRSMYTQITGEFEEELSQNDYDDAKVQKIHHWRDQFYISRFVFKNKDRFTIFVPDILSTPIGKVIRHNWFKNSWMFDDLRAKLGRRFNTGAYVDDMPFPNAPKKSYTYDHIPYIPKEGDLRPPPAPPLTKQILDEPL